MFLSCSFVACPLGLTVRSQKLQIDPAKSKSCFSPEYDPIFAQTLGGGLNLSLNAAPMLILGQNPTYNPARTRSFQVNGNDRSGVNAGACTLPPQPATTALGLTDDPTNTVDAI